MKKESYTGGGFFKSFMGFIAATSKVGFLGCVVLVLSAEGFSEEATGSQEVIEEEEEQPFVLDFINDDTSRVVKKHVMHDDEDLYLELMVNYGEMGVDKKVNGLDDDGDGSVDNHRLWFFRIYGCSGFVFDRVEYSDMAVISGLEDDAEGKKCKANFSKLFYEKVYSEDHRGLGIEEPAGETTPPADSQ